MDELKIESLLLRGFVSRLIKHKIKKNLGYEVDVNLKDFHITSSGGEVSMHLEIDADMPRSELEKILRDRML